MNFFIQMKESVTDFAFYRKAKDNRFGKSFAYFTILMLIIFALSCAKTYVLSDRGFKDFVDNYLPDFKIENGEFSSNVAMPHYVVNEPNLVFAIDTTGRLDRSILEGKTTGILITRERIFINGSGQHTEYSFKEIGATTLTKSDLQRFASNLGWIVLALTPFIFIFVLGWKLLNAVILAAIAMLLNSMYNTKLRYNQLLNISMYALTLPLLLQLAVSLSGYRIPYGGFFFWLISLSYVAAALSACRTVKHTSMYELTSPEATTEKVTPVQIPEAVQAEKPENREKEKTEEKDSDKEQ